MASKFFTFCECRFLKELVLAFFSLLVNGNSRKSWSLKNGESQELAKGVRFAFIDSLPVVYRLFNDGFGNHVAENLLK